MRGCRWGAARDGIVVPDYSTGFRLLLVTFWLVFSSAIATRGEVPTAGVYVRDSAVAVEKFALADRMQRLGEWGKAADVYQELLQSQADRVVLSPTNPSQYQSVIAAVQDRLCHWPPEGLEIYRGRFETEAAGLLEQALAENRPDAVDDPGLLHRIFANYFVTNAAKTAGIRLMDSSIEKGEFAAASWIGQRLLDSHPMLLDDRPRVLFREGIARHLAGDDAAAAAQLAELEQKYPKALGKVRGVDTVLRDALAAALKQPLEASVANSSENWPMPFGSEDRARLPASSKLGGARLFGIALDTSLPRGAGIPLAQRTELKTDGERDRQAGLKTGILPVIDRGELFFQDNVHVYAVSLESGLPLPGWQQTYSSERNDRYSISGSGWSMPRCEQEAICVTDDSVLAIMGQPDMNAVNLIGRSMRDSRLVCLDRRTGRERWVCTPQHLPAEPAALRELDFGGSPLVVGNDVYLIASGGQGMQFEDCYVVCLDLRSGDYKWSSYLASANNSAQMWEMDIATATGQNVSHIAYSGGRLYVATNVGVIAAIDAYSGSVIWLNMYPRNDDQPNQLMGANVWARARQNPPEQGQKPWTYNPVIVRDGKVFVIPSDGNFLHVYDAGTGAELRRVDLSMRASTDGSSPLETIDTLVGIGGDHGEWAVLASDRSVFCIDWKNYDPAKGTNNLRWAMTFAHGDGKDKYPDDSIRGRPFMTADSVFVPLAWQLVRLSLRNGATQSAFPSSGTWDESEDGPGNVLVTQDHLIIAGSQHVNVYTDIALATRKLDAAVAAAPSDPDQRLRYAEVLSAAGRYDGPDGAAAKLDEAAALLGVKLETNSGTTSGTTVPSAQFTIGAVDPSIASPRSRLFNDALAFAQKLQRENQDPGGTMIDSLYDRAAAASGTASESVTYRLQRAAHLHQKTDSAGELTLYQQILSDSQMRNVILANGDNAASPAGSLARAGIADLIQRCGAAIYAPYESQAKDAVASAQVLPDPQKAPELVAIAEMYPNSQAATGAMLAAADAYELDGNPRESAALMRQFCSQYPDSPDRPRAIESLARAYLEMPNRVDGLNVAIGRLEQGAKLANQQRLSRPLELPDGTQIDNVTFAQAAETLRNFQAQIATKALPDPCIPPPEKPALGRKKSEVLPEDTDARIDDVSDLILPLHDWARHDRVVTFSAGGGAGRGLSVYAVGANRPLFSCPAVTETPRNIAWMGGNLLVWCPSQLLLIRGDESAGASTTMPSLAAGQVIWDSLLHMLPAAQFASVGGTSDDDATAAATGDTDPTAQQPANGGVIIANGQRIVLGGGGQVFIARGGRLIIGGRMGVPINIVGGRAVPGGLGGNINQPNGQANGANPNGENAVEQIDHLVPTADRLVFSTSGGDASSRVVSLNLADGRVQWQTSLEDHQIEQLAANDDFVVIRAANEADVRLVAFDALTGQPAWRPHPFARDNNNDAEVPINLCLAEDGSLVYLMSDRICCKDLFDPDPKLRFPVSRNNNNGGFPNGAFAGATSPDQLLVSDGRVMALSDNGMFVRVYSLADGKPYRRGPDAEPFLNTEVTNSPWNVHLRVVGTKLYIFGPDKILHYDLDNVDDVWTEQIDTGDGPTNTTVGIHDLTLTKEDVLLTLEPASTQHRDPSAAYSPTLFLRTYSRALLPNGRESGLLTNADRMISDPSGITQLQVVDGGIYYATGDHQLHFLKGGGGEAAN